MIFFAKRDKPCATLLEAMEEPAFLFAPDGAFRACNLPGAELIQRIYGREDARVTQYDTLTKVLRFNSRMAEEGDCVLFGETLYDLSTGRFEDGILFRLVPRREDEHLLRLSHALDLLPWGLITINRRTEKPTVLYCNQKAADILQVYTANMVGFSVPDILRAFGLSEDYLSLIAGSDQAHCDHEAKGEGKSCWYRFHFIPHQAGDCCFMVIEDNTETKIREGQYLQAQRLEALGQLAGGVAHDFNNILSIIDGYARIAKKTIKGECEALNYLDHIMQAVQRGSALTSQLLTFGRHKVTRDKVIDLGRLVRDQEPLIGPLMDASIALSIRTEHGVHVEAAQDGICQILLNLCINARDAMPDGGNMIIDCGRSDDGRAKIEIIDTGCGMTPDVKAKMFDPFFTTKDPGKGTGLGLSMVYGMVKDMNGEIFVSSKPGNGTIFTILLPLSDKAPAVHELIEPPDGKIHLNGFTALVAEDEPDLLNLVSGMMEEMGATVLKASNGSEALLLQEQYEGAIDLLLTDVVMPDVNGVKLAELFGECRPNSTVMFMSGYPANGQMARVKLPEGALLMPKPVDFEKLSAIVKSVVKGQNDNLKDRWEALTGQWRSA